MKDIAFKRILVPTDFSKYSEAAIKFALTFAKRLESEVSFLYVRPPEFSFSGAFKAFEHKKVERGKQKEISEQEERLRAFLKKFPLKGLKTHFLVRSGPPYVEIILAAKKIKADLIILGTHGRTGLLHIMMGSVAERVAREASCPVMVVKPEEAEFKML